MLFTANGFKIYYDEEGAGEPVVYLHGWGSSSAAFAGLRAHLNGRGFRQIALDFPGCGQSPLPGRPLSLEDYAGVVLSLLRFLNAEDAVLCGHSNGGRVALFLAGTGMLKPKKLILLDAAGLKPKKSLKTKVKVCCFKAAKKVLTLPGLRNRTEGALNRLRGVFGSADYNSAPEVMRKTLVGLVNRDIRDILPRVAAPTLLIWGENDDATPLYMAKTIESMIPDCGLCVIPGAGHWCFTEKPAAVYPIFDSFLG